MEIAFAFLFMAVLCWMVWVEGKLSKRAREGLAKIIKKLKEENNARDQKRRRRHEEVQQK